jgi:hypothetical protein
MGSNPHPHECGSDYDDAGATVTDLLDDQRKALDAGYPSIEIHQSDNVNTGIPAVDYLVEFNAQDNAGNPAATVQRTVQVIDTTPPNIELHADQSQYVVHYSSEGNDVYDQLPGVVCSDTCYQPEGGIQATMSWDKEFNDLVKDRYTITYRCTDETGLYSELQVFVDVEDNEDPWISITGDEHITYEAAHNNTYEDQGATCQDYYHGDLNSAVQVTQPFVDMAQPGTYTITYECTDLDDNSAPAVTRTVVVQDTTCPQVTVLGAQVNYIESGFPYIDAGATAFDSLDLDITDDILSDGDSVDTAAIFYQRRSCHEILSLFPSANTAEYYITRWVGSHDSGNYEQVLVWCMMAGAPEDRELGDRTFYHVSLAQGGSVTATVPSDSNDDADCVNHGMVKFDYGMDQDSDIWAEVSAKWPDAGFNALNSDTSSYICVVPKTGAEAESSQAFINTAAYEYLPEVGAEGGPTAETGKYIITYTVSDAEGNSNTCGEECATHIHNNEEVEADLPCREAKRTVIVKDNLPPVITLAQRRSLFDDEGPDNVTASHAQYADANHLRADFQGAVESAVSMMAETPSASTNGWVAGGVAAAVSGLALLGYSMRRTPAATSVPV